MPSLYKKIIRNPRSQLRVTQDLRWNPLVYFEHETIPQNMKDLSPKERGVHTISFAVFNDTLLLKVDEQRTCDLALLAGSVHIVSVEARRRDWMSVAVGSFLGFVSLAGILLSIGVLFNV